MPIARKIVTSRLVGPLVLCALLFAGGGCAWLDQKQRQIIYRPTRQAAQEVLQLPAGTQTLLVDGPLGEETSRLAMWWLAHPDPSAPTLLYLHGTFRNLQGNRSKIETLRTAGFSVLAVDYRGWGQSTAIVPSEQSIQADAWVAWTELVRRQPKPSMRVIFGHSMGSGVAVTLASQLSGSQDFGALILESAFTSFADVADEAGFWASLAARFSREEFASIQRIAAIDAPLLMLHGEQDRTVPLVLGQRLFAAAKPPKEWVAFGGGGHSDLHRVAPASYLAAISAFRQRFLSQAQ